MPLPVQFLARRSHNARNGNFYSLRVMYATSRLPGDRSSEFGRLRVEQAGWNAFSSDEDFDRALKAACHRAGKHAELAVVLAEVRRTYMNWHHEAEMATEQTYEAWVTSLGDASGAGQDWDANSRV